MSDEDVQPRYPLSARITSRHSVHTAPVTSSFRIIYIQAIFSGLRPDRASDCDYSCFPCFFCQVMMRQNAFWAYLPRRHKQTNRATLNCAAGRVRYPISAAAAAIDTQVRLPESVPHFALFVRGVLSHSRRPGRRSGVFTVRSLPILSARCWWSSFPYN
jgi:hypothetical protein